MFVLEWSQCEPIRLIARLRSSAISLLSPSDIVASQVRYLGSRAVRVRRFSALSVQAIAEILVPAVLAGLFWFWLGGSGTLTPQHVLDLSGLIFFTVRA
jgi:hypothetical protein